ncbi:hypothetical protein [Nonomuraea sp. GTA35]|uniref:hypothetical protein n=1 Tax=Nonomuraea sp. GTA35 TaxID=1676746 RepID=UPI0035BF5A14
MTRYSVAAYGLKVAPFRQNKKFLNLGDMDGRGLDLLHLIHGFLKSIQTSAIIEEQFGHYLSTENITIQGRSISFGAEYGRFGFEGAVKNVRTNRRTHRFGVDESAVVHVRNMIIVPPSSNTALLLAERCSGRGAASIFLRHLTKAFRKRFHDEGLILHKEGLTEEAAWKRFMERARLTQIKVVRYSRNHDLADAITGIGETYIGRLEYTVKPLRSSGLARQLISPLMDRSLKPETQILGLRDEVEADEIRLQLTDGDQQREIVLGKDGLPTLVYPIKTSNEDRPPDEAVYDYMTELALTLAQSLELGLPSNWKLGSWTKQAKAVQMEAVRDEC